MNIVSRPWEPQDLLDDLQMYIDEEPDNYLNGRRTTMCMARDFLKEHFREDTKMMEWISVKERLPEENQRVILHIPMVAEGGNVRTGWLEPIKMWFTDSRDRLFYKQVTHWMPLPEPPKEDET